MHVHMTDLESYHRHHTRRFDLFFILGRIARRPNRPQITPRARIDRHLSHGIVSGLMSDWRGT